MSVNDPISDMLTRIRNGIMAGHTQVMLPSSKMKVSIAKILVDEGFIEEYGVEDGERAGQLVLKLGLKYVGERRNRQPVITGLKRVSSPGRRIYAKKTEIPWVLSGLGVSILSTPKGVMTGRRARSLGVGGELLCTIW